MQISVWDTYVERKDKAIMHFDILVPDTLTDEKKIFAFGNQYLNTKSIEAVRLSATECKFCHMQQAPPQVVSEIEQKGYAIIEMENCN